jgi:hypothetical protein
VVHEVDTVAKAHKVNLSVLANANPWQNFPASSAEKLTGIFTDFGTDIFFKMKSH